MINESLILTDVDGVLCNWEHSFTGWVEEHGYTIKNRSSYRLSERYGISEEHVTSMVTTFNESAAMGFLPSLRDAIFYVKKLHELHGYVFHAITSFGTNRHAHKLRQMNLNNLFGSTVFEELICLPVNSCKRPALERYRDTGCFWLEDKIENAIAGQELGLQSILIAHDYNTECPGNIPRARDWNEVYKLITGV